MVARNTTHTRDFANITFATRARRRQRAYQKRLIERTEERVCVCGGQESAHSPTGFGATPRVTRVVWVVWGSRLVFISNYRVEPLSSN